MSTAAASDDIFGSEPFASHSAARREVQRRRKRAAAGPEQEQHEELESPRASGSAKEQRRPRPRGDLTKASQHKLNALLTEIVEIQAINAQLDATLLQDSALAGRPMSWAAHQRLFQKVVLRGAVPCAAHVRARAAAGERAPNDHRCSLGRHPRPSDRCLALRRRG